MCRKLIILLSVMFSPSVFSQASECVKTTTLENYQKIIQVFNVQITSITKVLDGKPIENVSVQEIFGRSYRFEQSQNVVTMLDTYLANSNFVQEEHEFVTNCLLKFKKDKELSAYKNKLQELLKLRKKLILRNIELNNSIYENYTDGRSIPSLKSKLVDDSQKNIKEKEKLEQDLLQTEVNASSDGDILTKEIKAYQGLLTKLKIDLLNKKISQNQKLEDKLNYFTSISEKISKTIANNELSEEVKSEEIENIWLEVVKEKISDLSKTEFRFDLPTIPEEPVLFRGVAKEKLIEVRNSKFELIQLKKSTIEELTEKKNKELKILSEQFIQVSKYRSAYLKKQSVIKVISSLFSSKGFDLLKNEIYSAPFRLISYGIMIYHNLREKISLGREGIISLSLSMFFYLLVATGIFFANRIFLKAFKEIESKRTFVLRKLSHNSLVKYMIGFWNKIKENFVPLLWIVFLTLLKEIEFLKDFSLLANLAIIYLSANIFKSFVLIFLGSISKIEMGNFLEFKKKAHTTALNFRKIFLVYFSVVYVLEVSIGHLYLFTIFRAAIFIYSFIQVIKYSSIWEEEFTSYLEKRFSGFVVKRILTFLNLLPRRLRATLIFFVILFLSSLDFFVKLTENLEISKKVSANLFKKQIEKIEADEKASQFVPEDYKQFFSLKSLEDNLDYIDHLGDLEKEVLKEIDDWKDSPLEDHSIVLFGDKGIGKTTFLKHVMSQVTSIGDQYISHYLKIPSKTLTKKNLNTYILDSMGSTHNSIMDFDKSLDKKVVVFIDESQNVFLSKNGGFDAYYELTDIVNLNTENIFWVLSFNRYSWLYLNRAFGRTQFFRNVFELKGWDDSKIKELILTRHQKSEFKLSYDLLISATSSQDEIDRYSTVESKFFKLLWELSRGNPRTALYLWLTALSRKNLTTFNVNIPKETEFEGINKLSDELMFVCASLFKHENLSPKEIEMTTNLPSGLVRNAIKYGKEKKFLFQDDRGRLMIDISAQYLLTKILKLRNFIYGN